MRIRALFVTPKWGDGGGERTWLNLLAGLDRERFEPSLAWFEKVDSHFLDEIPDDVRTYDLGKERRLALDLPRAVWALRTTLRAERPHVVLSLLHTWGFVLDAARTGIGFPVPVIANEHIHVDSSLAYLGGQRPLLSRAAPLLHRLAYRRAARVVGVSEVQMEDLRRRFHVPAEKTAVIPVGVDRERLRTRAAEELADTWYTERPLLLAVGRLIPQKAFDDLLHAFAVVAERSDARLAILGEGELRPELERLVVALGLSERVRLPGLQENPYRYLGRAAAFVLSSRWEALPQVVIEALALGVPVVATDCPSGPRELLSDGHDGILVPPGDIGALAQELLRVLEDEPERERLAAASLARGGDFDVDAMVRAYERELLRAASPAS